MKREYSKSERQLVEAVVGLFVILPNPQLGEKKDEVMKIAFEVLDNMIDNPTKKIKEESENDKSDDEADELDDDDEHLDELIEERINEIIEKSLKL